MEIHDQLAYGYIHTNYQKRERVCLLWQKRAAGSVADELKRAMRLEAYDRAKMIVRETLKCAIYAMGTPVYYNRIGLTITDCNTRNILWL
eukprot:11596462-Prorocentrum_lima.AAC.1